MPYTAQFFAEKLNVPVEYFNPFRNVQINPSVDLEELSRVAHSLGEVVGLGLRNLANCPVELNLMPDSTLRWQAFNQKKPYFIATIFSLVLVAFAVGFLFQKLAESKEADIADLEPVVEQLQQTANDYNDAKNQLDTVQNKVDEITTLMELRYYWGDVLTELKRTLISSEDDVRKKLSAQKPNVEAGIWIDQMTTLGNAPSPDATAVAADNTTPGTPPAAGAPNEIGTITLVLRAVNLSGVDSQATSETAFAVQNELQASPIFDPKATQLTGQITPDDSNGTFTFGVTVALQNPFKF